MIPTSGSGTSSGIIISSSSSSSSSSGGGGGSSSGIGSGSGSGSNLLHEHTILPVLTTAKYCLIHLKRQDIYLVAVSQQETPPLLILEWLNRVADTIQDYFGSVSEEVIKENFVIVYQLLDEMMDGGHVMTVEGNVLQELIQPPSLFSKMREQVLGPTSTLGTTLPEGITSTIYWRRNAKYTTNEIFLDIIEEIDAILDKTGNVVTLDTLGKVVVASHLSGMPDLTLRFTNPNLLDDVSFHPCVRLARYAHDKAISFIPPDGQFTLMTFRIPGASSGSAHLNQSLNLPLQIQPSISFTELGGKVHITVTPKLFGPQDRVVENVVLTIPFPKSVAASATLSANVGTVHYDEITKVFF
jgi:AP-3 complex subunit mu